MMRCDRRGVRGAAVWAALPTDANASMYPAWWFLLGAPGCGGYELGANRLGDAFDCSEEGVLQFPDEECSRIPKEERCGCTCVSNSCSRFSCQRCAPGQRPGSSEAPGGVLSA